MLASTKDRRKSVKIKLIMIRSQLKTGNSPSQQHRKQIPRKKPLARANSDSDSFDFENGSSRWLNAPPEEQYN